MQLLKAYGLTEQGRVVFADTGSCGITIESIQSALWDLATSVYVPLSARSCVQRCMICISQPLPVCVKFRLCVCAWVCGVWFMHVHTVGNMFPVVLSCVLSPVTLCRSTMCPSPLNWCRMEVWRDQSPDQRVGYTCFVVYYLFFGLEHGSSPLILGTESNPMPTFTEMLLQYVVDTLK